MTRIRGEAGAVAALVMTPIVAAAPAVAVESTESTKSTHCVVETRPMAELERGVPTEARCYPTVTELLRANGLAGAAEGAVSIDEAQRRFAAAGYLAYHHVDANAGGISLAVSGSCDGSGIASLPAGFNDQISSTRHLLCGRIKHFADANAAGDHQITSAGYNAVVNMNGQLNDRVSSTYYYET